MGIGDPGTGSDNVVRHGNRNRDQGLHKFLMAMDWNGLREKVSEERLAGTPGDFEVTLTNTITYPVISHVDTFRATLFYGVVGETKGTLVVTKHLGWRLGVAEGEEDSACKLGYLGHSEHSAILSFSSGGDNHIQDGAESEHSTIR